MGVCNEPQTLPRMSVANDHIVFNQEVQLKIQLKNRVGVLIDFDYIDLQLKQPNLTFHLISNGIGYSQWVLPGWDPRGETEKVCQDNLFMQEIDDVFLFGVFDGHGKTGAEVSQYWVMKSRELFQQRVESLKNDPEVQLRLLLADVTEAVQSTVKDIKISGTTAIVVYFDRSQLYVASIGDSKAVLGYADNQSSPENDKSRRTVRYQGSNFLQAKQLSISHKPIIPQEKERIEKAGGEIRRIGDEYGEGMGRGPLRAFKRGTKVPGICMTRSIGDMMATEIGVISEPSINTYKYNADSYEVLILATDGLWDVMEDLDAVNFVEKFRHRSNKNSSGTSRGQLDERSTNISHLLAEQARRGWIKMVQEEDVFMDDIGIIVIEFKCEEARLNSVSSRKNSTR